MVFGLEHSARSTLAELTTQVSEGLSAASDIPGLLAAIDQHGAAVRDIVTLGVEATASEAVVLAGYARGLIDQAKESGWQFTAPADWSTADWVTTRLLSICALATGR
ncbi:MAG TPA: DUF6401 family natural product biosynthesis protein [Amycolatopsis sp.]|uniref:DUF6401 family natural product biosynthesis protein n=1 Tax=Amycolatopsis sp. TaxID=37632 RepID=UPI002B497512|nr:DUF6401 family natural product biosynthesis protein [Amycolatopsis sp.]HKS49692.1 DUF6401 family natural product biosynthesis protein [Amycolatopsis sp.]